MSACRITYNNGQKQIDTDFDFGIEPVRIINAFNIITFFARQAKMSGPYEIEDDDVVYRVTHDSIEIAEISGDELKSISTIKLV